MSLPNDIPEAVLDLVGVIAETVYLKNYKALRDNFGAACPITKKGAEIFISEHRKELEELRRALNDLSIGNQIHEESEPGNATPGSD